MRRTKKFIINTIILTITSLVLRTINTTFSVYLSHKIGTEGMGLFKLIMSVYGFAVTVSMSGIGLTVTRIVAEQLACNSHSGIKLAVKKCSAYSVFCGMTSSFLLFVCADYIALDWLHGKISVVSIYLLCVSLPFMALSAVLSGYFTAVRRISKSASSQVFEQLIRITVTVYFLNLFAPKGLDYACMSIILGGAISEVGSFFYLFILFIFDKQRYKLKTRINGSITRQMFSIAVPVAVSSYIRSALSTYKQIIIPIGLERSGSSCDKAFSQYGIISGMVMPIIMFPSAFLASFNSLIIPELAESFVKNETQKISYVITRIFKITLLFSVCVSGIFFFYADELSMMIYKNLDSALFIKSFSPVIVIMYLDDIVDSILKGLNEQVRVVGINIVDSIISIILLQIFLPFLGIKGYILVFLFSEVLNGFLSIERLIKVANFKFDFISWIISPYIGIVLSIWISKRLVLCNVILGIIVSVTIYLSILYILKIIDICDFTI